MTAVPPCHKPARTRNATMRRNVIIPWIIILTGSPSPAVKAVPHPRHDTHTHPHGDAAPHQPALNDKTLQEDNEDR